MRPNAGLIQALRVPFALNLQALRALLAQNQLRLSPMVDMEARHDLAPAAAYFNGGDASSTVTFIRNQNSSTSITAGFPNSDNSNVVTIPAQCTPVP